ncbi:MAG: hypothetical protein DMG42_01755 [Acidobacteria bacterium]|nr:MAG: hypothetical protein DMG42_01755 [Acidobacteriota bacterium]
MWRRVAICFSFGILCLVQGWALPSTTPAQGRVDSSGGRATGLPDIPEACKTPRMRPEAPAEVPRNEVESQGLSAEAYESLGTFYGREGQFSCAIAAFQAALARNPDRHEIRYKLALSFLENHAPQRAADELRVVLGAEPDSFKAHNALGRALQDLAEKIPSRHLLSLGWFESFARARPRARNEDSPGGIVCTGGRLC